MSRPKKAGSSPGTDSRAPCLLIVARDQLELYHDLQFAFGASQKVTIILDRRCENRRRRDLPVPEDRRRMERRSLPHIAEDPRFRQYVMVRPYSRRPHIPSLPEC